MNARLRPLREDEFEAWYADAKAGYAESIEHDAGFARDRAEQKAEADMTQLIPNGRVPDGHAVGRIAMEFAEEEARRRGLGRVALNVFGGNDVARGLYRSLGYREVSVWMATDL